MNSFKDYMLKEKYVALKDPSGTILWIENTEEARQQMVRNYYNALWERKDA